MAVDVVMPAHGMAMTEGLLIRWLRQAGEIVAQGEPIAEIETDKTNAEVVSPTRGMMGQPLCEPGTIVQVGMPIVQILDGHADADSRETKHTAAPPTTVTTPATTLAPVSVPIAPDRQARRVRSRLEELAELSAVGRIPEDAELANIELADLDAEVILEWLASMLLIREFEDACDSLALAGKIPGGVHSAAGQEAVAIGTVRALAPTDVITSTHRSHHHSLAKGLTPRSVMGELYGKVT